MATSSQTTYRTIRRQPGEFSSVAVRDAEDIGLGAASGSDALIRWSTGDASNHTLVIALGDSNQALHITDKGAVATDWNVSADTHPTIYVHSNTTPATDYLKIGGHDGTTATIDVVGGTTLNLDLAGTNKVALATNMTLASGHLTLGDGGTVSQATSITTGVTLSTQSGQITTQSASTAAGAADTFTVTNTAVAALDVVNVEIATYSGTLSTNGIPVAIVTAVGAGSFDITIANVHATNALSGTFVLNFAVVGGAAS